MVESPGANPPAISSNSVGSPASGHAAAVRVGSSQFDPDVLRAIAVLNDGIRVDWGQYALDVVKDCADGVKRELFSIRRPSSLDLYGCSALVTIVYLVNTATPQPPRWTARGPQIRHFTYQVLTRLDEADKLRRLAVDSWRYMHAVQQVVLQPPPHKQMSNSLPPPHFPTVPSSSLPQVVVETGIAPAQTNPQGTTCDLCPNQEASEPNSPQDLAHIDGITVGNVELSPGLISSPSNHDQEHDA
ncbi:hypothetical protein SORBI_3002G163950 [Sorghum bicolor]|uniref:Uncharacterized protein n=1 Tax=Sorghum bicolor TaxID=4558 RepID=A0A1W0W4G6_SORBI|nr:hypothetical protein SORBI_3002G163950 [Sorghum bicolor]